ncbi:MAG: 4'-phosphopantetheinyl transferase superfamily protein [Flavitalea sp.]
MGIFFQHSINEATSLGIWKIEEAENFFLEKVPKKQQVSHPYKRLQHLAGRYLLPYLFHDFPLEEIIIADTRKPFLTNEKYHFSISHCGNFAAAVASTTNRVGVDIEMVTPRLKTISHKFLTDNEAAYLNKWKQLSALYLQMLTIIWCSKEAIFKWYGNGNLDFRKHMILDGAIVFKAGEWIEVPFLFTKDQTQSVKVMAKAFDTLILAFVVTSSD